MIRALLALLVVVAVATLLGLAISEGNGYVLIAYKNFRYESTLWVFLTLLVALWLALFLARWLVRLLVTSGSVVNPWSRRHRHRRASRAAELGMLDLAEGRWDRAARHLEQAAQNDAHPLMLYLGAARAENHLGHHQQADALLERALQRQPKAELAVALAHAELQQERGELDAARETLEAMRERHPRHHRVLRQLALLERQRGDWTAVLALLPELRKQRAMADKELATLEKEAWSARLDGTAEASSHDALQPLIDAWQHLPAAQRQDPELLAAYARQLRQLGADAEAEEALRAGLRAGFDSRLVDLYGSVVGRDPARQLHQAETWLGEHPQDPLLLRCLARLCVANRLWGKARDYFEASLGLARDPQTCAELARLLAQLGETERSNALFQEGLGLLDRRLPLPLRSG
jgi:HemY protein